MRFLLLIIASVATFLTVAQNKIEYSTYDWDETFDREKYDATGYEDNEATVMLDRNILAYTPQQVRKSESRNKIYHQVIWIEEESAIEKMNRLYLYVSESISIRDIKVRTISLSGEVVMLDESKMEDVSKDDGNANYKILAIPGIEVKSWVEIYIDYKGFAFQNRLLLKEPFYVVRAEVIFQVPNHKIPSNSFNVEPEVKGYNGFLKDGDKSEESNVDEESNPKLRTLDYDIFDSDSEESNEIYYNYSIDSVPPWSNDEKYAQEYQFCPRVDITLSAYKWKDISYGMYSNISSETAPRKSRKVLKEIGASVGSELEKLRLIENYVKQNITTTESSDNEYSSVSSILNNRVANETGILRTFMSLLKWSKIDYKLYFVADEDYIEPDKGMPMTIGFEDFLFYLPNSEKYIMPTNNYYRVGNVPNYMGGCKRIELMSPYSSSSRVVNFLDELEEGKKEFNVARSETKVKLDLDEDLCRVEKKVLYYGDLAIRSRGAMNYMDESEKKDYLNDALVSRMKDVELKDIQLLNEEISHNSIEEDTLIMSGVIESEEMLTSIGSDYLINLTQVIGYQSSFYDEGERVHKIFLENSKTYEHKIEFVIPDGYTLEGTDQLLFNREYVVTERGSPKTIASFVSTAEIVGNVLHVNVNEFYEEGFYPKEDIEVFKDVINAAYEFYIVKLKLTKK